MSANTEIAVALDRIVSAVSGVQQIYPAHHIAAIGAAGAALLPGVAAEAPARVRVSDDVVQVVIGVGEDEPAAGVARAVNDVVRAHLDAAGLLEVRVHVKIARIG